MKRHLFGLIAALLSGCGTSTPSGPSGTATMGPVAATGATAADLAFCVTETNRYRAMVPVSPVTVSAALEAFAAEGARIDAQSSTPHAHFNDTPNVARAENEVHRVRLATFGTVRDAIEQTLASYWNEGPSGGHYKNLTGPYSLIGCGVTIRNGELTFVQDFL